MEVPKVNMEYRERLVEIILEIDKGSKYYIYIYIEREREKYYIYIYR